jgi:hypothetical protein
MRRADIYSTIRSLLTWRKAGQPVLNCNSPTATEPRHVASSSSVTAIVGRCAAREIPQSSWLLDLKHVQTSSIQLLSIHATRSWTVRTELLRKMVTNKHAPNLSTVPHSLGLCHSKLQTQQRHLHRPSVADRGHCKLSLDRCVRKPCTCVSSACRY